MVQGYIENKQDKTKYNNPLFHCIKVKRLKQEQKTGENKQTRKPKNFFTNSLFSSSEHRRN